MSAPLKAAVIGVGQMGKNHARVYSEMPDTDLIAIADANPNTARQIGKQLNTRAYQSSTELLRHERPDVISIATPTAFHYTVASEVISHKCHLLLEKPIAANENEAQKLITLANQAKIKFMIGHIERFNPAIQALHQQLSISNLGQVYYLEAIRVGPPPTQTVDTGVTMDLAVHDLDIIQFVTDSKIRQVIATVKHFNNASNENWMQCTAQLENNIVSNIRCDWITPIKKRALHVVGAGGLFQVDYLTQDLTYHETVSQSDQQWEPLGILRGPTEGRSTKFALKKKEPLRTEIELFINAIRSNNAPPVSGEEGLMAVKAANSITKSSNQEIPIALTANKASGNTAKVNYTV